MNQRFQFLNFTQGAGKVTVTAPANANLAPPGDYLLFLVDTNGVPSVGSFVRLVDAGDTTAPTAPTAPRRRARRLGPGRADAGGASTDPSGDRAATTSTARRRRASRRPTANRVAPAGRARATPTSASSPGPTTTRSLRTTTPATRAPPRTRRRAVVAERTAARARRRVGIRRGQRDHDGGQVGEQTTTERSRRDLATAGQVRQRALVQRHERLVTVPDSNSLDLTTGMTLEAWVQPDGARHRGCQSLLVKERPGNTRLRPLREHRQEPARSRKCDVGRHRPRRCDGIARSRPGLDAPRRDLRRHHPAPLRQRHPGRAAARGRLDRDVDRRR